MKKSINRAVLVSGGGTNLQAIIDFASEGKLESGKIVKVISFTYILSGITMSTFNMLRTVGTVKISLYTYCVSFFVNIFFLFIPNKGKVLLL